MRSRLTDLLGIDVPIIQAPMAGAQGAALAIAVAEAGGLGSIPSAVYTPNELRAELTAFRAATSRPVNVNFFCHEPPAPDAARAEAWLGMLESYFAEHGLEPPAVPSQGGRASFDEPMCEVVEDLRPEVVSFHFGLPGAAFLDRVKAAGALVMSSATTVAEARWLETNGCDVVIAQGAEAGGHRGVFLPPPLGGAMPMSTAGGIATQVGTFALVPQVVDAVTVPVVAAGGIADGRGIAAALVLGAAGVQIGTAYLRCPESAISALHRRALTAARDDGTALTNVFTGRPARSIVNRLVAELGPMAPAAPSFPLAAPMLAPLRAAAESAGSSDFSSLWAGQAAPLTRELPARELTTLLAREAQERLDAPLG